MQEYKKGQHQESAPLQCYSRKKLRKFEHLARKRLYASSKSRNDSSTNELIALCFSQLKRRNHDATE